MGCRIISSDPEALMIVARTLADTGSVCLGDIKVSPRSDEPGLYVLSVIPEPTADPVRVRFTTANGPKTIRFGNGMHSHSVRLAGLAEVQPLRKPRPTIITEGSQP